MVSTINDSIKVQLFTNETSTSSGNITAGTVSSLNYDALLKSNVTSTYNSLLKSTGNVSGVFSSIDYDTLLKSKAVNSLDDYKRIRSMQLYSSNSSNENIDYESEFNEYLKSRGCESEEDLQALNNTGFNTMDDLKNVASSNLQSVCLNMIAKNPDMISSLKNINSIVSSANTDDLVDFVNSSGKDIQTTAKAAQTLLSKINDEDGSLNLDEISSGISALLEQLEEEGAGTDEENYQESYNKKLISQYGE